MYTVHTALKELPLDTWASVENKTNLEADLLLVKRSNEGVTLVTAENNSSYSGLYIPEDFGTYVDKKAFAYDLELASRQLLDYTIEDFVSLTQDDEGLGGSTLIYGLIYERDSFAKVLDSTFMELEDLVKKVHVAGSIIEASLVHNDTTVAYL